MHPRNVLLTVKPSFSQHLTSCQFSICANSDTLVNLDHLQWWRSAKTGFNIIFLTAPEHDCWQALTKNIRPSELQVLQCRFTAAALLLGLIWPLEFIIIMWFKCQVHSSVICLKSASSDYPALRSGLKGFSSDHMGLFTVSIEGALEVRWNEDISPDFLQILDFFFLGFSLRVNVSFYRNVC